LDLIGTAISLLGVAVIMYAPSRMTTVRNAAGDATDGGVGRHVPEGPSHGRLGVQSNRSSAEEGVDAVLVASVVDNGGHTAEDDLPP
jgi:hypothetical protein